MDMRWIGRAALLMAAAVGAWAVGVSGCLKKEPITYGTITDTRDGKTYKTVKMPDGKTWMAQNLNYMLPPDSSSRCYDHGDSISKKCSWCYDNEDSNCVKYGRLYDWKAAMSACPAGWRLPTEQDWDKLIKTTGRSSAGRNLKSKPPIWNGRDKFGFSALPGGFRTEYGDYGMVGQNGGWWFATMRGNYSHRYMHSILNCVGKRDVDSIMCGYVCEYSLRGHSVRCVADAK